MSKAKKILVKGALSVAFAAAAVGGIFGLNSTIPTAGESAAWLLNQGYSNVQPADGAFGQRYGCAGGDRPHLYTATNDKTGETSKQVVCVGLFHRLHQP